jgi:hypothetical protein
LQVKISVAFWNKRQILLSNRAEEIFMSKFTNPLNNIKIASPCSADWNKMPGDERARFCGECKLNVYNLSGMSQREAENLLINSEGRLCVRFYKRSDGAVLTKDCPVGWQAIRQRVSKIATAFTSLMFAALSGTGLANYFAKTSEPQMMETMSSRIENLSTKENVVELIGTNTQIQRTPAAMGRVTVKDIPITGAAINTAEVRHELQKKRKR